jgi:Tfp pilus assembly protein PilZ
VCSFRKSGDLQPNFGLTHNVSAGGLYVRTLDVPAAGASIWIELRLPHTNQTVHLRGEVVSITSPGSGTARPPGFGIKLLTEQCLAADLEAFLAAYTELAARNAGLSN